MVDKIVGQLYCGENDFEMIAPNVGPIWQCLDEWFSGLPNSELVTLYFHSIFNFVQNPAEIGMEDYHISLLRFLPSTCVTH